MNLVAGVDTSQGLTGSCSITWGLVRNTDPQVLPETYEISACVSARSLGDLFAH